MTLQWREFPIRYFVTNADAALVSAPQFQAAVGRGFATWHAVETARTSSEFVGFVQSRPFVQDGASVLGFLNRPDQDRTLAATTFTIDTTDGRILESDIFFNYGLPLVDGGGRQRRSLRRRVDRACTRSATCSGCRTRRSARPSCRAGGRRVIAAESVMFPIAFSRRQHRRPARSRPTTSPASRTFTARPTFDTRDRQHQRPGHQERPRASWARTSSRSTSASGKLVGGFTLSDDGRLRDCRTDAGAARPSRRAARRRRLDSFFDDDFERRPRFPGEVPRARRRRAARRRHAAASKSR